MTKEEIINTPELVDFMLDESVIADLREKLRKRLNEICNLAIKALKQEPTGHWISHYDKFSKEGWYECDCFHTERAFNTDYCPDCGAKMADLQKGAITNDT